MLPFSAYAGAARRLGRVLLQQFTSERLAGRMEGALRRSLAEGGPVVVGPWTSEVGFEVLYWIPFLRWVLQRFEVDRGRVTAISRGGAPWYRGIAGSYVEIFERLSPSEFQRRFLGRASSAGTYKQLAMDGFDREVLAALGRPEEGETIIHPSTMYQLFMPFWSRERDVDFVLERARFGPIQRVGEEALPEALPRRYTAAKFYFSRCFPPTEENRRLAWGLVGRLAEESPVVLLDTGLGSDDHAELEGGLLDNVWTLQGAVKPADNLAVQTAVLQGSEAFVGTYGGFSYLGPLCGVSTLALYSHDNFNWRHLEVARRALAGQGQIAFAVCDVRALGTSSPI